MVCTLQPSFLRIENPRGLYAGANEKGGGIYAGNHYKYGFHQVNTGNENESLIGLVFYSRTEPSLTSSNYAALFLI